MSAAAPTGAGMEARANGGMPTGLPLRVLPIFFFLHVPKTAGTSLIDVFSQMFGGHALRHEELLEKVGDHAEMLRLIDARTGFFDRYLMVMGHMNLWNPLVVRADRRRVFLSVFREPVARVVSHYEYLRRHPEHPFHAEVAGRTLFEAFERAPNFRRVSVNEQLLQVFGTADPAEIKAAMACNSYVVGKTERMDAFLDAAEAATGLRYRGPVPLLNAAAKGEGTTATGGQPDFADAVRAIREANRAEIEFFEAMPPVLATQALTESVRTGRPPA